MRLRLCPLFAAVMMMAVLGHAVAQSSTLTQTAGNLIVQLEILAPAAVENDPMHQLERQLHRGAKPAGKTYHVLVAIYNATTRARSTDIESVTAKVIDSDGITPAVRLEPMSESGEVGYGNYFDFSSSGPYGIVVAIRLRGEERPVELEFSLAHLPDWDMPRASVTR